MVSVRTTRVVIIMLAMLCMAAPAMAATLVVNPDGSGNFTTIQAAVDSNWTDGDTIRVEYGLYEEAVSVDGSGNNLYITGVQDVTGAFPVIDAMGGENALFVADGDFFIDGFMVTNATAEGLNALAGANGTGLSVANLSATANEWDGISADDFAIVTFRQIESYENGWNGLAIAGYVSADISEAAFFRNGADGLYASGNIIDVFDIYAAENSNNGINIIDEETMQILDTGPDQAESPYGVEVYQIYAVDNGGNGLEIYGNENGTVVVTEAETNTNDRNGVLVMNHLFAVMNNITADENGWGMGGLFSANDAGMDGLISLSGNGICVSDVGQSIILSSEASGNYEGGIHLQETVIALITYCEVSENWYGINEFMTNLTFIEQSSAYNNYIDYRYDRTSMVPFYPGEIISSLPSSASFAGSSVMDYSVTESMDAYQFDGALPMNLSLVLNLQISDPGDDTIMPSVLSFYSNSTEIWVGQTGFDELYPPAHYHDAGRMYAQVWGDAGSFVYHEFVITPEFPPITAEGLSAWGTVRGPIVWQPVTEGYNVLSGDTRYVGGLYIFPEEAVIGSAEDVQCSAASEGWGVSGLDGAMNGYPAGPISLLAPFWYEPPGGDDAGVIVTDTPASGSGTSGSQQEGSAGTEAGSGDTAGVPSTPVPTAAPDDEKDTVNVTSTMTPSAVGESASPTVPVTQMPDEGDASGSSGALPWVVLLVVIVVIGAVVYFGKIQKK